MVFVEWSQIPPNKNLAGQARFPAEKFSERDRPLNRKAYVKHFTAGWADKKPPGDIALF